MEKIEILSSTDETVQYTPRYEHPPVHHQTKTTDLSKSRRSFFSRKKKEKNSSKAFDSTCTLIENPKISQSLNNHNLKISLKSIYDQDPVAELKKIFKVKHSLTPKILGKEIAKNLSGNIPRRKRSKLDSIYLQNEADLIMEELKTIKSPEVWQKVVQKFKQRPSALMDLIPIDTPVQGSFSPKMAMLNSKFSFTPVGSRRHCSSSVRPRAKFETPKITRPGSISPLETVTFLEEKDDERLTDDWSKSLLYKKIANEEDTKLAMGQQEMIVLSRKPPREPLMIETVMQKGLKVLRVLLLELLGTKEDMERFEERFKGRSPVHIRALMERCLNLINIRNLTFDVLVEVNKRENIMKNLKNSKNKIKEKVLKIYELNQIIRKKIEIWKNDPNVPFDVFMFMEKDYLEKISEDNIFLQEHLTRRSVPKSSLRNR